ncbi:MAG: hypothetical protein JWN25_2850 [Verrucomicrobiales bacterium]|nr:hypothetical protein [Verrucomicrobiales bacterium]
MESPNFQNGKESLGIVILKRGFLALVCLITLLILCVSFENWRGSRSWKKYRAQAESKGAIFEMAALTPPPIPPEENFAEIPLLQGLFKYRNTGKGIKWDDTNTLQSLRAVSLSAGKANFNPSLGDWRKGVKTDIAKLKGYYVDKTPADFTANRDWKKISTNLPPQEFLSQFIQLFEAELDQITVGLKRPHARFAIHYGDERPFAILLPHLSIVKNFGQIFELRAILRLHEGKHQAASEDVRAIVGLSETLKDEHLIVDQLVRMSILNLALQVVWEGIELGSWNSQELAELDILLSHVILMPAMVESLKMERAAGTTTILQLISRPSDADQLGSDGDSSAWEAMSRLFFVLKGWGRLEAVNYSRMFDDSIFPPLTNNVYFIDPKLVDRKGNEVTSLIHGGARSIFSHTRLASLLLPAISKALSRTAETQADLNCARLSLAIEKMRQAEKKLPENLQDLIPKYFSQLPVDPVLGGSLHYVRHSEISYSIYSVGWDGVDNGGKMAKKSDSDSATKETDWVWRTGSSGEKESGETNLKP